MEQRIVKQDDIYVCPKCGGDKSHYDIELMDDEHILRWWTCDECGSEGRDEYIIDYEDTMYEEGSWDDE